MIRLVRVEEVIDESKDVKTIVFKDKPSYNAKPGQFLMVWIPRVDEIPMSVMIDRNDRSGYAAVTVRRHGYATTALYNMIKDSIIGVRGPYGKAFKVNDKHKSIVLVGGGTGLVPLIRLCRYIKGMKGNDVRITLIMGFKSKEDVFFEDLAYSLLSTSNDKIIVTTDDGSYGMKGYASDALEHILASKSMSIDAIYTCGPEKMMYKVLKMAYEHGIYAQASLERVMKCGIGICGSCSFGRYVLCKDGPVMDTKDVLKVEDFARYARDKSGRIISI
jgi:dihydroorotate dehydrogenase electron transfer subunit